MKYVLPVVAINEEELSTIQSIIIAMMLNKMECARNMPTEIRHGPVEMGGLDLMDLCTKLGISQLR